MGIYSEYLGRNMDFEALTRERKQQLKAIARLRGNRDVLVYASDLSKGQLGAQVSIDYTDLLPISDQLANLSGTAVDVILETPGGDGTVAEDIVRMLRTKYESVSFIIPGYAKSAGTIIAMSGDEILMGPVSALGPIDAQLFWQGKVFSAEALLEGLKKIKDEVTATGGLNRAYIPILQGISPGEIQHAENALEFAKVLVTDWLTNFKFRRWTTHRSSGAPVTPSERKAAAVRIADNLCSHKRWLSHGKSIKIQDLQSMELLVEDYAANPKLFDAIQRYYTLLQMTFATNIYKVIETSESQIYRMTAPPPAALLGLGQQVAQSVIINAACQKCGKKLEVQANLGAAQPLGPGMIPYPKDNLAKCPHCHARTDLSQMRQQIEVQTQRKVAV